MFIFTFTLIYISFSMKMEEATTPIKAKKLCIIIRMLLLMIQKGVTKSKIVFDLDLIMKRGKILRRAINDVMSHHYDALTCRSRDVHASFVCPREYEFSCSSSPAFPAYFIPFHVSRRHRVRYPYRSQDAEEEAAAVVEYEEAEESPLVGPVRRHVRVTDSPFPLKDDDVDCHVDKAAEEFIQMFYKQLRLQKSKFAGDHYG